MKGSHVHASGNNNSVIAYDSDTFRGMYLDGSSPTYLYWTVQENCST